MSTITVACIVDGKFLVAFGNRNSNASVLPISLTESTDAPNSTARRVFFEYSLRSCKLGETPINMGLVNDTFLYRWDVPMDVYEKMESTFSKYVERSKLLGNVVRYEEMRLIPLVDIKLRSIDDEDADPQYVLVSHFTAVLNALRPKKASPRL